MKTQKEKNSKQQVFREMVLGTLVYSVVLGFFNDYTDILDTKSYSTTFAVAIVMQVLTYFTFQLKGKVVSRSREWEHKLAKPAMVFGVWLIMFLSKFVFLVVIDFVFGDNVTISGFFGLLAIIITMTVSKQVIDTIYQRLGAD